MNEEHPNLETILGLRQLADFLESCPQPTLAANVQADCFPKTREEFLEQIRGAGRVEKRMTDSYFYVSKSFAGGVRLEWNQDRNTVCTKVLKETKTLPAEPERTVVIAAKPERTEEVFEWECPDSILAPKQHSVHPSALITARARVETRK